MTSITSSEPHFLSTQPAFTIGFSHLLEISQRSTHAPKLFRGKPPVSLVAWSWTHAPNARCLLFFYWFVVPNLAAWNFKRTTKMFQSLSPPNTNCVRLSFVPWISWKLSKEIVHFKVGCKPIEFWSVMMQHSHTSHWWGDPTYRQPIGFTMGWELPVKEKTNNHWESGSTIMICKTPSHSQFTTSQHQVSTGCFASFRMKFEERNPLSVELLLGGHGFDKNWWLKNDHRQHSRFWPLTWTQSVSF